MSGNAKSAPTRMWTPLIRRFPSARNARATIKNLPKSGFFNLIDFLWGGVYDRASLELSFTGLDYFFKGRFT